MFLQVMITEFMKLRRSKVTWLSLGAMSVGPLGIAFFMWILKEPGRAQQLGLVGKKATISGLSPTWTGYLSVIPVFIGIGGLILMTFVVAYVFGREYADGTAKNMLALPIERYWFVAAKFIVVTVWWAILVAIVLIEIIVFGIVLGLNGFIMAVLIETIRLSLIMALMTLVLSPVAAWITVLGRGYMPPLAFVMMMLIVGNILAKTEWAKWFPWAILPLYVGVLGQAVHTLPTGSIVILALTSIAGIAATVLQLQYADNTQ